MYYFSKKYLSCIIFGTNNFSISKRTLNVVPDIILPGTSQKLLKTTILPSFWTKIRKMFSRPHLKRFEQRSTKACKY